MAWKTKRRKTSCGIVASFRYTQRESGKWKVVAAGNFRAGRNPVPSAFVPFEISNAVCCSLEFETEAGVLAYIEAV